VGKADAERVYAKWKIEVDGRRHGHYNPCRFGTKLPV